MITLGHLITWDIANAFISSHNLKDLLNKIGVSNNYLPRLITPRRAIHRAVSMLNDCDLLYCAQDNINNDEIIYAHIDQNIKSNPVELRESNVIIISRTSGHISLHGDLINNNDIVKLYYSCFQCFRQRELTHIIKRLIKDGKGFPVNNNGHLYYLPIGEINLILQIKRFCNSLNGSCDYYKLYDHDNGNRNKIINIVLRKYSVSINELKNKIEHYETKDRVNMETKYRKKLKAAITSYKFYQDLLGIPENKLKFN